MQRMSLGAALGTTLGLLGWLIGLAAACVGTGEIGILKQVALPGLVVSLGIAGIVIVTADLARATFGPGAEVRMLLWAELLFFVGVLVLLVNHWIAPLIDTSPTLRSAIARVGGGYRAPDALPAALMAAGIVLLGLLMRRLRGRA